MYKTDKQDLLYSTWNNIQYLVIIYNGKESEKEYIYITESLCCTPETITTLLIDYTPISNKKLKNKLINYKKSGQKNSGLQHFISRNKPLLDKESLDT